MFGKNQSAPHHKKAFYCKMEGLLMVLNPKICKKTFVYQSDLGTKLASEQAIVFQFLRKRKCV